MPSFLDLPAELRNAIYKEVLVVPKKDALQQLNGRYENSSRYVRYFFTRERAGHALTQVSRQIRNDNLPMFLGENVFEIDIRTRKEASHPRRHIRGDRHIAIWAKSVSDEVISSIQTLRLWFDSPSVEGLRVKRFDPGCGSGEWCQHLMSPCKASEGSVFLINLREGTVVDLKKQRFAWRNDHCCCSTCLELMQAWVDSINVFGGKRRLTREHLLGLIW